MPKFDEVKVGDELPPVTKAPDRAQLVLYCAGSGDFNPLHWDQSFEQARQIGDNIVHGRMKWSTLGQLVSDWVGASGWVKSVACQYRGMDLQGTPWQAKGVVADKREENGQKLVEVEVWTENDSGQKTTPGRAVVVLDT
ncbi:MAG: MaoC/PaaZ C-terminal domain-containing protein [Acidimicrobiia bacterium]|nr:MaoC/PaaZ C-terminal domain-containing protein [Acidimicrobiia bacterium]MDH4348583.1 MaoC/PaaZ C-terminal domain-containing protein [Gemmatimonadota bacterium]MDH5290272.1 MaoC/PaaZ C-terminal domain-containing protein [Acidimicrobiia bacterium]